MPALPQPAPPKPASYAEEREKFLAENYARGGVRPFVEWLQVNRPLDALTLATELARLMQLRANDAALARDVPAGTKI